MRGHHDQHIRQSDSVGSCFRCHLTFHSWGPHVLLLALRLLLDARLASALIGGPWLVAICEREAPHCQLRGVHEGDRWMERTLGIGWGTRGVHGMVAKYAWPYVPQQLRWCGPIVLDVPFVSALITVRRANNWRCTQTKACREWRGW